MMKQEMRQEPEEQRLKELFQQLKQDDERHAPSFARSWAVAQARMTSRDQLWRGWRFVVATASVLLIVSGCIWSWRTFSQRSTAPPQQAREARLAPILMPTPPSSLLLAQKPEQAAPSASPRSQRRVWQQTSNAKTEEVEVVTQFFPLREGVDLTALESEQLVRVELPGSALSEAGLPVDFETAQTSVKADVVLGPDGLARAIRFVR